MSVDLNTSPSTSSANYSIKDQTRLAQWTRIVTIMRMAMRYETMLKLNLMGSNPFDMEEFERAMLAGVVGREVDEFIVRHIPVPKRKGVMFMPSWTKNINDELNENWLQYEEGLITWHEFINCYVWHMGEQFRTHFPKWDINNERNLFI